MAAIKYTVLTVCITNVFLQVEGHAYMSWPSSRNFDKCDLWNPQSLNGHCSNCNTDCCGKFGATDFTQVAHNPTGIYKAGDILEVETIITAHHMGYMELRICNRSIGVTQECFDEHLLIRDSGTAETDPAPIDENHPGRWYIPPPATNWPADSELFPVENECSGSSRDKASWTKYQWKVRLPGDLECDHCVLQWFWVSANSCTPPGFREYFDSSATKSWIASKFGGDSSAWWGSTKTACPADVGDPKTNGNGAEKFWNCGDITIARCSGPSCATTPTVTTTTTIAGNMVIENAAGVGGWGGSCTCPDGMEYQVGDNNDFCGSLACDGGVSGTCHHHLGTWSNRKVVCAQGALTTTTTTPISSSNTVIENAAGVGGWGGSCTCPDGMEYQVGDNFDFCGSLACDGGVSGTCHHHLGTWSNRKVVCAQGDLTTTTTTHISSSNTVIENAAGVGGWGGSCTCPDGMEYQVGDNNDFCGSLACVGGVSGTCHHHLGTWSNRKVVCAQDAQSGGRRLANTQEEQLLFSV